MGNEFMVYLAKSILQIKQRHCDATLLTLCCVIIIIIIIIIITISLRSVSASEDVIEDPSRPGTNNKVLLDPRRKEREKVVGKADQLQF